MRAEETHRTRASRIGLLALFVFPLAAPAAVLAEQLAPPRWHAVPSRSSGRISIVGNRVEGLYPGASTDLILTVRNPYRNRSISIRGLRVRDVATTKRGCAPTALNLEIRQYAGPPLRIAAGRTRTLPILLTMPKTVADACQRATFELRFSAQARR